MNIERSSHSNTLSMQHMNFAFHKFATLDPATLFAFLKLRVDVFVVEQNCAYPELDEHDTAPDTLHLLCYIDKQLAAYARAMPSAAHDENIAKVQKKPVVKIGRVVVAKNYRGTGVAKTLMTTLLNRLTTDYPDQQQILAAQDAVAYFYAELGFKRISEIYLEDGIPHVDMLRTPSMSLPTEP